MERSNQTFQSRYIIAAFFIALVLANLLVKKYGAPGLWISSFILIPFDFVCRCVFHETWTGKRLVIRLFLLTMCAALLTVLLNFNALNIAMASIFGFCAAQLSAGIFYQSNKKKSWFFKVNISDLIAIVFDSIVFQLVAFGSISWIITGGQIVVKFIGGLLWYYIIFKKLKLYEK